MLFTTIRRAAGAAALAGAMLAGGLGAPAQAEDGEVIRIGVDAAYKPFMWRDEDGEIVGWEIELAKAFCDQLEAKCTFDHRSFDTLIPALNAEKIDAIVASMYIKKERQKKVQFTDPYYFIPGAFVAPKDMNIEISKDGLAGKIIGVQRGTLEARYVQNKFSDVARIKLYDNQEQIYLDANARRIDVMLAQKLVLKRAFLDTPDGKTWEFVGPPVDDPEIYGEGAAVAVRKNDDALRRKLDEAIDSVLANGTYEAIRKKWFDIELYNLPSGTDAEASAS